MTKTMINETGKERMSANSSFNLKNRLKNSVRAVEPIPFFIHFVLSHFPKKARNIMGNILK
jgi:hypothetical protein